MIFFSYEATSLGHVDGHSFVLSGRNTQHAFTEGRLRLKCDGTRAETRFRLSAKRTSLFKGRFTHSMPCPCHAHAVPLPCRAAKGLECVFPI